MRRMNRRNMIVSAAAIGLPAAAGCQSETVSDVISDAAANVETETIEEGLVALKGFEIVAWEVGKRVIFLPHPAIRIIGVTLIISAGAAKLAIEYLDVELNRRKVEETLSGDEVVQIESDQSVTFQLENGYTENVALGPSQYE